MLVYRKGDLKRHESVANRKFCVKDDRIMENKKTVLLADANEEFRVLLGKSIEKSEEFTVVGSTGDGTEALRLLEQQEPEIAIIDLVLPGTDGVGLLRHIREKGIRTEKIRPMPVRVRLPESMTCSTSPTASREITETARFSAHVSNLASTTANTQRPTQAVMILCFKMKSLQNAGFAAEIPLWPDPDLPG